jgi:Fic family protein
VRTEGDWEGWIAFFLECVRQSADDGVDVARRLFAAIGRDRQCVLDHTSASVSAIRLFDLLPDHPIVTVPRVIELLKITKPTASKAIKALQAAGVIRETTGRQRDRIYAYDSYLRILTRDTERPTS